MVKDDFEPRSSRFSSTVLWHFQSLGSFLDSESQRHAEEMICRPKFTGGVREML